MPEEKKESKAYAPMAAFVVGETLFIAFALLYHYDPYKWFRE